MMPRIIHGCNMADIKGEMMELVELAGSQRMAATASGIDQATISRVCSGRIDVMSMKVDTVRRMKTALKSLRRKSKRAA